jgi:hypothetical protein
MPSIVAPRKLGVSCRVSVPVGSGRATQPSRVWRPGRRRREDHDAHEGRSVDRASLRPSGGPRPRKGWYCVDRRVWRTPRVVTRTAGHPRAAAVARLRRATGGTRPRPAGREMPPHVGGPIGTGCGNPARPGPCGGRRVTGVPTAETSQPGGLSRVPRVVLLGRLSAMDESRVPNCALVERVAHCLGRSSPGGGRLLVVTPLPHAGLSRVPMARRHS